MALVVIGTITVDMWTKGLYNFPAVTGKEKEGRAFFLEKINPSQIQEYGYLVVVPQALIEGVIYEIAQDFKFYDKGIGYMFIPVLPDKVEPDETITIGLYPIQMYRYCKADPRFVDYRLSWIDDKQEVGYS